MAKSKNDDVVKPLTPKSAESKYVGPEPTWNIQPTDENRISSYANAFNWYNYHYGKKDAKNFIANWLDHNGRTKDAKTIRTVPDSGIRLTPGWVCRMSVVGLQLSEHEIGIIDEQISQMLKLKTTVKEETEDDIAEGKAAQKLTIQDHLREKVSECAGELEGMFDEFIKAGSKMSADYKPLSLMRGMNISPNMVNTIADIWKNRLTEFEEVLEGNDELLVEGYANFTKVQLKQVVKFCEQVIADCGSYVAVKKVERKPRAKKAVPASKVVAKFKYLREFAELKLKSVNSTDLVNASEAWLYDTQKRKLIHVVADSHAGTFTIKGGTIIGFDALQTVQKTLRKPETQLKSVTSVGKPAARKAFADIKATETKWSGRGNENLVILKAF